MRSVLLTGFEPFGSYPDNPTRAVVQELAGKHVADGVTIVGAVLPCSYDRAPEIAIRLIEKIKPVAVLSLGYASRKEAITIETTGRNWQDSYHLDCDRCLRDEQRILVGGPEEVATTAPNYLISQYLRAEGLEVGISDNAEAFVCNTLIYRVAIHLRDLSPNSPIPFTSIHTPTTDRVPHLVLGTDKTIIPHVDLVTSAMIALRVMIDPDGCDGEIQPAESASTPALHIPFGTPRPGVIRRSTHMIGSDPTG